MEVDTLFSPDEDKVVQRPCCSTLLPSWCFATTVVTYYDRSTFSMAGPLGNLSHLCCSDITGYRAITPSNYSCRCGNLVQLQTQNEKIVNLIDSTETNKRLFLLFVK